MRIDAEAALGLLKCRYTFLMLYRTIYCNSAVLYGRRDRGWKLHGWVVTDLQYAKQELILSRTVRYPLTFIHSVVHRQLEV